MAASWQERFDNSKPSYTKVNDKKFADLEAGTTILIPSPADIDAEIAELAPNEMITFTELRDRLAERHLADGTCPVMCGMNLRVVAELTFDALDIGVPSDQIRPVWSVIDPKSALAKKLNGGSDRVEALRNTSSAQNVNVINGSA